jgi:hypothetical protein
MLAVVVGLLTVPATYGQEKPAAQGGDSVHRMEIIVGPRVTVYYFPLGKNTSPGELQTYRNLAQAENEAAYVDELQALRRQYISGEKRLEYARQAIQPQLYGASYDRTYFESYYGNYFGGYSYGYPYGYFGGYGGYGGGNAGSVTKSLAIGVGPEGSIKEAMAKALATHLTPEYSAAVNRQLSDAVAALPQEGKGGVVGVGFDPNAPGSVTVYVKGDHKIEGKLVKEDADWIVVQTRNQEERIRMSEVTRITKAAEKK